MSATISKDFLRLLRVDIDAALAAVGAKHGLKMNAGTCRFTETTATFKLEVATIGENGEVASKEHDALISLRIALGLTEANMNQVFKIGTASFTLHGYDSKKRSKPFLIKRLDNGKNYVIDSATLAKALGNPEVRG